MIAAIETVEGIVLVDLEAEQLLGPGTHLPEREPTTVELPRVVAAARAGSTVVAVIERRPPLAVSHDGGSTWRETGGGLPRGFGVAVDESSPDRILYAARNRLYLSNDGGTFWRRLEPELADIVDAAFL